MHRASLVVVGTAVTGFIAVVVPAMLAFEGRIHAVVVHGTEATPLLYTVGTDFLRIEVTATNGPYPVNIVDIKSGVLTLLFPHNSSFVRVAPVAENRGPPQPGAPGLLLPPGVGPQSQAATGVPAMRAPPPPAPGMGPQLQSTPANPAMPMPMSEKFELRATGEKTTILGLDCERYELKQRGETLEVWATDPLFPYQPYVRNQPHRFGPRGIEERWPGLLTAKRLFPLRASLRMDYGAERFRFDVKSIKPEKTTDEGAKLFQPPTGWSEIEPLPF